MTDADRSDDLKVAIIGMAGRFPGARDVAEFWQNLCDGVCSIRRLTDDELRAAQVDQALLQDQQYVRAAADLAGIDLFDAAFFGHSPREAELLDPQHRLFLEIAWEALEQAGYTPEHFDGLIGVYAGASMSSYLLFNLLSQPDLIRLVGEHQVKISNDKDYLATRVAYKLGLEGPSVGVQTACSTSLVAVHLACQSLLNYQCDLALAGGVTIDALQGRGYRYQEHGILSPDGYCRAFDAQAQGTVSGNGLGIVVLKRLDDALADGDTIHAVVRASAVNNDGAQRVGFTAPRETTQARLIALALSLAEVSADQIGYVEAHGSGTILGDPIEIAALNQAFRLSTDRVGFCPVGSVKTNIGHLDAAAGIAGLIKAALALKHGQIPPSLNFERPNPQIDFSHSPFYVNTELRAWPADAGQRLAGVSAFGLGGTNAHVVLEAAPPCALSGPARDWQLLLLSARTESALEVATERLAAHLRAQPAVPLADVAYTLQVGRKAFEHRRVLVCADRQAAARALEERDPLGVFSSVLEVAQRPIAFMFPGLGDQYVDMGLGLYQTEPIFRAQIDRCAELLKPLLGRDIRGVLYPAGTAQPAQVPATPQRDVDLRRMLKRDAPADALDGPLFQTVLAQAALFVVEYALAQLWLAWGIRPQALIGYSLGEYVAATLAGVFALDDALTLVVRRAELIQALPHGAMLAVQLSEEALQPLLTARGLSLSAVNGPMLCVAAGARDAVLDLEQELNRRGIVCRRVQTNHAFHSTMLEAIAQPFRELLAGMRLSPPTIPSIANVSGTWITPEQATDPAYWVRHLCAPVRFADGLAQLWQAAGRILLEVGPGQALSSMAVQHPASALVSDRVVLRSLRHAYERQPDPAFLLETLGKLWLAGVRVDWRRYHAGERRARVPLPTYPFERQRYWIAPVPQPDALKSAATGKKPDVADWFYAAAWRRVAALPAARPAMAGAGECWLLLTSAWTGGAWLAEALRQDGQRVVGIAAGDGFARHDSDAYRVRPDDAADYERVLRDLQDRRLLPTRIVHLWNVTPEADSGPACFDELQALGLYSLLALAQALAKLNPITPVQLRVIANGLHEVTGDEPLIAEKATLLAPCTIISQEYAQIACQSIDLRLPAPDSPQERRLLARLLVELRQPISERVLAFRGEYGWAPLFEPMRIEPPEATPSRLRQQGVYLITGGLGRIGLSLARYLAEAVQARLVLVGRKGLPLAAWSDTTPSDPDDLIGQRIQRVRELEQLGAEVLVLGADVGDAAQMRAVLDQIYQRYGALHGIIHAAGIVGPRAHRMISETGAEECRWHFQPKVRGVYVLEELLHGIDLDFCFLLSSLSPILGGIGFSAYAAANLFMDAFVRQHNRAGGTGWTSLNWEGWQFQPASAAQGGLGGLIAQLTLTPEQGVETFRWALSCDLGGQVIVSTGDLAQRIQLWSQPGGIADHAPAQAHAARHARPHLRNSYVAPSSEAERAIAAIWEQLLGLQEVGLYDNFFELGGNSLIGLQVVHQLRQAFQRSIPLTSVYEGPTVSALAGLLAGEPNGV
jgi:acyl transferase domain-containing protein